MTTQTLLANENVSSPSFDIQRDVVPFLEENCLGCHDGEDGEGGFDLNEVLSSKSMALSSSLSIEHWSRVFDRVNDGEMPPKDEVDVDVDERQRFLLASYQWIDQKQSAVHAASGRAPQRRLTNQQLENTLHDLLSIDIPLARLMPDEQRTDGFRNIADAQSMSHYHLQDHLRVVDTALDYAFERAQGGQREWSREMLPNRIASKRKGQRNRDPELRKGAAVVWSSGMPFYGRISNTRFRDSGWYHIKVKASSLKMKDHQGLWCSVRSGECNSQAPLMHWIGSFEATETPNEFSFTAWIDAGHLLEIRIGDVTLKTARFQGGQVGFGEGEPQNVPGLALHSLKLERLFPGGPVQQVRKRLLGDLGLQWDAKKKRWDFKSEAPRKDIDRQVRSFARAAFRRPVDQQVLAPFLAAATAPLDTKAGGQSNVSGDDIVVGLKNAYRAILCSPRFIYFYETPGKLDDHAVANRLSYMLTGHAPDATLRKAANEGHLSDRDVLVSQTRRLLKGRHLEYFVADFTDQWLDLADINFTEPDRRQFRDFDLVVEQSMVGETRRYVQTLLKENRPASWLVESDFTWLNNRLADYYDLDLALEPNEWKRVSTKDNPRRGGLMTHGAILKVTANGNDTSPVLRGVWVCDRLLGVPIPDPPDNVPAIEPDIRGAKTVRQILEKHRSQIECAACHARIDPPGFALEHFDAAGRWRDYYTSRSKEKAKVDSAYRLRDGREFETFAEFRSLAASDDEAIARNFAAKLLTFATGKETTFADRKALDQVVAQTEAKKHGLRSLVEAVVTSEPFLSK